MSSLVDKVIVFGVPNPERLLVSQIQQNKIEVTALEYYSLGKEAQPPPIDYEMWAYPDGIKILNENFKIMNDPEPEFTFTEPSDILAPHEYIYSFVLTDYELNRTYCTCISWNEKHFIKNDIIDFNGKLQTESSAVPKCKLTTLITNPLILDPTTMLVYVPKVIIVASHVPCLQLQRELLTYLYRSTLNIATREETVIRIPLEMEAELNYLIKTLGYPKAETLLNEAKSVPTEVTTAATLNDQSFNRLKSSLKQGYLDICAKKLKQFLISTMFLVPLNPKQTYVVSEAGKPICGQIKQHSCFHLPYIFDMLSPIGNFSIFEQVLTLPVQQLIQLWKCVLLEKQILIFSSSQHKSIFLCELLMYLIQPIKWENIYIPFLPFHLSHHVDAIGGYLIGMGRIHMNYMMEKFDMKDKVVVDLDHSTVLEEGGKDVIELPNEISDYLQNSLKREQALYEDELKTKSSSFKHYLVGQNVSKGADRHDLMIRYILNLQKIFFHSLILLFNNFIPFIRVREEGIIAVATQDYLSTLKNPIHQAFMKEISKTMVFIRLCEYHIQQSERCAWVQKTIGELFVYSHDILSQNFTRKKSQKAESEKHTGISQPKNEIEVESWDCAALFNPESQYYQYIEYLFNKDLRQILETVRISDKYFQSEIKKYEDYGNQPEELQDEELLNLMTSIELREYQQEQKQRRQKKKWKKFGEKDEDDLYDEMHELCKDLKIERYLMKYIKYLELTNPSKLVKVEKAVEHSQAGWLHWLWDLLQPPQTNRRKEETQVRIRLQRKLTVTNCLVCPALNLYGLFDHLIDKDREEPIDENSHQSSDLNMPNYKEKLEKEPRRASQVRSDVVKITR